MATVVLTTTRARTAVTFGPIDPSELTEKQRANAVAMGATGVAFISGKAPAWLSGAAEDAGYVAKALGYTNGRGGYTVSEVWGLAVRAVKTGP